MRRLGRARLLAALGALLLSLWGASVPPASAAAAPVRHVFVIVLENKEFAETFGPGQAFTPYLQALARQGALIPNYFGIGHSSADNYIAMVSGQPPTTDSKNDCADPLRSVGTAADANGVAQANGCEYPAQFQTVGDQLSASGLSWRAYAENMPSPCSTAHDAPGDYARKHNGFVFFDSVMLSAECASSEVPFSATSDRLASDLAAGSVGSVNYVFPNECEDGHSDCTHSNPVPVVGAEADELGQADAFLHHYVPLITGSPAYRDGGLLLITWDEGDDPFGCCGEPAQDPDGSYPGGEAGSPGTGGGQVGAVALSPFIAPGTVASGTYNHYSMLASIEDAFGLGRLGEARLPGTTTFGSDLYTRPSG